MTTIFMNLNHKYSEHTDAITEQSHAYAKRKEMGVIAASSFPVHIFLDGLETVVAGEHSIKTLVRLKRKNSLDWWYVVWAAGRTR